MNARDSGVRMRPLRRDDVPMVLKLWLDGWDQTFAVWGPMVWRKFARYACALAAATLLLTAGAYVLLRDPATLQAAAAAAYSSSSSSPIYPIASASSALGLLRPMLTGLKLVAADVALVLPRWALAAAAFLGLLLPSFMTAMPRRLQVALMKPLMMRGVWTYCPDMEDMYAHWAKPEEGREYYVAVGLRELPAPAGPEGAGADSGSNGPRSAAAAAAAAAAATATADDDDDDDEEEEEVLGGVAIKAGAALRPLPPMDGAGTAGTGTGNAASAAGPSPDCNQEEQQQLLRQRKPSPPTAAAAAATADGKSSSAASSAAMPAKAAAAAATDVLPTGFTAGESSFHDSPGPNDVLLYRMIVDPTVRRRGVGRRLVEHVMARTEAVGGARVLLATGNPEAVRFYEACGFSREGLKQPGRSSSKEKEKGTEQEKDEGKGKGKGKGPSGPALLGRAVLRAATGAEVVRAVGERVVQAAGPAT